ncbi:MAG: MFS transporter [Bacillota bacterium]
MDQARRNLYVLWVGNFLAACSFSLVMPFLPRFIAELGVTENLYTWSGLIYSITFLSSSIMAPVWGNLADRYGRKPMLIRAGVAISIVYVLMSLVKTHVQLFWLRLLNGAFSGFIPSAVALVATNTPEDRVGRYLAILQTGMATGTILGPLLGGTLAEIVGIRWTMRVAACLIFAAVLLVIFLVRERVLGAGQTRTSVVADLKIAVSHRRLLALLVSALLIQASLQSLQPILSNFIPTLAREGWITAVTRALFGQGEATDFIVGFVFSLPAIATVLMAPRLARVGERIGFARLLSAGLLAAGLLILPQSLVRTVGWMILLRFAFGIATAAALPSVNAALAEEVHPSFRGRAYGINTSANNLGSVLGPSLGGWVADAFGPRAVFVLTGLVLLATSAWVQRMLVHGPEGPLVGAPHGDLETG